MYFGTRTARASTPHLPKIILLPQTQHAIGGQIRHARPEIFGLLIGLQTIVLVAAKHRCPHAIFWEFPHLCEQLPRPCYGFFFEVIAKRPVAQHLKKRVMVGTESHFFQIVVRARNPQTLLRIDRP